MGATVEVVVMVEQATPRGVVDDPRVHRVLVAIHGDEFSDDELDDDGESDVPGEQPVAATRAGSYGALMRARSRPGALADLP